MRERARAGSAVEPGQLPNDELSSPRGAALNGSVPYFRLGAQRSAKRRHAPGATHKLRETWTHPFVSFERLTGTLLIEQERVDCSG
jgi:hypothetical protein